MHEFNVWAPLPKQVRLKLGDKELPMHGPDDRGWWRAKVDWADYGMDYGYLIDNDPTAYPDPRTMSQPNGVHGMTRLYDQHAFEWKDQRWQAPPLAGAIIYEMHIGTFSAAGTFDSAIERLDYLVDLGVTHVELMPVVEFAGNRGWGYDGVSLFAVFEPYGGPDGLKRFVSACHEKHLAVILDVVYNHFGPVGMYATKFAPYLTDKYHTPWGAAVNFNEEGSDQVRRFFCDNAAMWLRDYHCDGLRLDAVHEFIDRSAVQFMEQISAEAERLGATLGRKLVTIAESDLNDPKIVRPREARGYGMDAQWSDDFHHSLFTLLFAGQPGQGYYDDFGTMEDLQRALTQVFVFSGDYSMYRKHTHGRPVEGLSAHHFLAYIQNHDQVGNRARGERMEHLVGMDAAKVALGLVLTAPFVPMLFMGEEYAASTPFLFFADHEDEEMRRLVCEGRKREFAAFGFAEDEVPDPESLNSFTESKLKWDEIHQGKHADMLQWVKDLIHLRRTTVALNDGDLGHTSVVIDEKARTLVMERGSARVLMNIGERAASFPLRENESMRLASRTEVSAEGETITLPPMSLAVALLNFATTVS